MLDPRIREDLRATWTQMMERGELLTEDRLRTCYDLFRRRFGPDVLAGLDGEALLRTMHEHGNRDSLVYWIEFKDDEEFPATFGSIAGGSALKFGLYFRKETGQWMTGHPHQQQAMSVDQAVAMARRHRDQLIAGANLLDSLPVEATAADYARLQQQMDQVAPDVGRLAWGHKYLSLLHPDRLDDYHAERLQRFHLIKLLQVPAPRAGRYELAHQFVTLGKALDWPLNHLSCVLNKRHDPVYQVWRIAVRSDDGVDLWPLMRDHGMVSIGWPALGNLDWLDVKKDSLTRLVQALQAADLPRADASTTSLHTAREIRDFVSKAAPGDLVLAGDGNRIHGIGRVAAAPYRYDTSLDADAPHQRMVEWLDVGDWELPVPEGLQSRMAVVRDAQNLIAVERRLLAPTRLSPPDSVAPARSDVLPALTGVAGEVQAILERKGQVILYGPPGTGKTWHARRTVRDLAALKRFGCCYDDLDDTRRVEIDGVDGAPGLVRVCTFHPAYGYEDFLEGYRPVTGSDGRLSFERRDGLFKRLCSDAEARPEARFYLLIDEINRGDIPRIFGELLTLLEKDKRGHSVQLPLSGESFSVPSNLFVVGTMNTADRSIALLDTALRRRFGFRELMPETRLLSGAVLAGSIPLDGWLTALNARILTHVGRDARNLQIGHAYLLEQERPITDMARFTQVLAEDIVPLLEEYCYEDYEALRAILGPGLVDLEQRRIRRELFEPGRRADLVAAILAPNPELATSAEVTETVASEEDPDDDDDPNAETGTDAGRP
ncbi:conserved hypothetical protein [Thiocapsa sp. KS1]|nr:AAA family ATPase [Thiocapsa sp. KS1]CRI66742.1 conserved hypothetical protein [Thiocapsa sp. KS1]